MTRTIRTAGLSLAALAALALAIVPARAVRSQVEKPDGATCPIEGAWKLLESKNGDAQEFQKLPDGTEEIKFVTGGRFVWVVTREGRITAAAGGKYKVDKDKYTESIEYIHGEGQTSLVGKSFDFTWKIDGKTWLHVGMIKVEGQDLKIDEKWERCN
jgi:hypothetical protein